MLRVLKCICNNYGCASKGTANTKNINGASSKIIEKHIYHASLAFRGFTYNYDSLIPPKLISSILR